MDTRDRHLKFQHFRIDCSSCDRNWRAGGEQCQTSFPSLPAESYRLHSRLRFKALFLVFFLSSCLVLQLGSLAQSAKPSKATWRQLDAQDAELHNTSGTSLDARSDLNANRDFGNAVLTAKKAADLSPLAPFSSRIEASLARYEWAHPQAPLPLGPLIAQARVISQAEAERDETARAVYEKGLNAVKQKDWNLALRSFLDAQAADPYAPPTLFNLGLVSEKIPGHQLRAIAWFQAYLLAAPGSPDAAAVRNEVARLEASYEAANRAILDQLDSFISLAKKNIDQLSQEEGQEWVKSTSSTFREAAEFQAGSHYFVGDDSGALRVLHVADENVFRDGELVIPIPGPSYDRGPRDMASAMLSAGFEVQEIVYGPKLKDFTDREIAQLDFLLEAGDLEHAWIFINGWRFHNVNWVLGAERFLCAAHQRSDAAMFTNASMEIATILPTTAAGWAYSDFVRLYLEIGEVANAKALAKAVPADLERQTGLDFSVLSNKEPIQATANGLMEDFRQGRIQARSTCPAEIPILMVAGSDNSGSGPWRSHLGEETIPLWWSTGRLAFLAEAAKRGVKETGVPIKALENGRISYLDFDETQFADYIKVASDEILTHPQLISLYISYLTRFEFKTSKIYRQIRGPVRGDDAAHHNLNMPYENQGLYDRGIAHYTKAIALGLAAGDGHLDVVREWVARGADVNAKDAKGDTPLFYGAANGHLDVVQFLVAQQTDVNAKDSNGFTALHTGTLNRHLDVVQYLVTHGADVNAKSNTGWTPLHFAALFGTLDLVQCLVEHGAAVNAKRHEDGQTPLHEVAIMGKLDLMQYLVQHGADVGARSDDGSTPLLFAAYNGQLAVVHYLVEKGADVNARDKEGLTPLGNAHKQGKSDVVQYLAAHGGRK